MLADLRRAARPTSTGQRDNDSYGGSGRPLYNVAAPVRRAIVRRWLAERRSMPPKAVLAVIESLFEGQSHEEKTLAAILLASHPKVRLGVRPGDVERWLSRLNGWAEIDSLCQSVFTAPEMLADWPGWSGLIERLSGDANINKRRAALVLLTAPVHYSDDGRFRDLALATIERLKAEREILITKAVSWLLRSMAARHHDAVTGYVDANAGSLPAIAVRETRTKLRTGTKSGRSQRG